MKGQYVPIFEKRKLIPVSLQWTGVCFLIVLALAVIIFPSSAEENERILKSSFEAPSQVNFEGIKKTKLCISSHELSFITRVIYQKPDFTYVEYLEPSRVKGKILIDDGKRRIEYFSQKDKLRILPSLNSPQIRRRREKAFNIMLSNFNISSLSQEKILGRGVYVVRLSSEKSTGPFLKLWIDKQTYLILREEKYNSQGQLVSSFRYTRVDFNKHFSRDKLYTRIPGMSSLREEPPEVSYYDKEEIVARAHFPVFFPDYLPPGYNFQGAELIEKNSGVKLIYTNGLEMIVLFQISGVDIMMKHHRWMRFEKMRVRYTSGPHGNTLVWNEGDRSFVLIGRLPLEELAKIAKSVR